jgi:hypothetical protein
MENGTYKTIEKRKFHVKHIFGKVTEKMLLWAITIAMWSMLMLDIYVINKIL